MSYLVLFLRILPAMLLIVTPEIQIPASEFELSYVRSSGPGGQNVNKVNSKAVLRWNIYESPSLPVGVRARLLLRLRSQITTEGILIITSDRFRDQIRNREDCFEKLKSALSAAATPPPIRKKTKPSRSSQLRIKDAKDRHSQKKHLRRSSGHDD